jgi:hypothetical protein
MAFEAIEFADFSTAASVLLVTPLIWSGVNKFRRHATTFVAQLVDLWVNQLHNGRRALA